MPATKEKPLPDFKSDDRPTWIAQGGVGPRIGQGPEGSALAGPKRSRRRRKEVYPHRELLLVRAEQAVS
jgi:hypothetical protein